MGFSTMPITIEESRKLINDHEGEVVSASKEEYFNSREWMSDIEKVEIKDDSITLFFTLVNEDFVEYCLVSSEEMSS